MAVEMAEVVAWVLVDEHGNWVVDGDPDNVGTRWEEEVGERNSSDATRLVKVVLQVPKPRPVVVAATVAELPDDATVAVA
jgi:hypothetical protein